MKVFLKIFCVIGVISALIYSFFVKETAPQYFKELLPVIEERSSEYINGKIHIGKIDWTGGLSASVSDVVVTDAGGKTIADIPVVRLELSPWRAFGEPMRALSKVVLADPQVYLFRNERGEWNTKGFLKESGSDETPFYGLLEVVEGKLHIEDNGEYKSFAVEGSIDGGGNPRFAADLSVRDGQNDVQIKGLVTTKGLGGLTITGDRIVLDSYSGMVEEYCGIRNIAGMLENVRLIYDNDGKRVRYSGTGICSDVEGTAILAGEEHSIKLQGKIESKDSVIYVDGFTFCVDGQEFAAKGSVDLSDVDNIAAAGTVTAERFAYRGHNFTEIMLPLDYRERRLIIKDAEGSCGSGNFTADGTYNFDTKVASGDITLRDMSYVPQGQAENTVLANGTAAFLAKFDGEKADINVAAESFDLRFRGLKIHKLNFDGKYKDQGLYVDHFSASAGQGTIAAEGAVYPDGGVDISGYAADFPLEPLLTAAGVKCGGGSFSSRFTLKGSRELPELAGALQLKKAHIMGQPVENAEGGIFIKDGIMRLQDFVFNMAQGKHLLQGTIDFRAEEALLDLVMETNEVRIEPLGTYFYPELPITGNFSNILDIGGTLQAPRLEGRMEAADGSIGGNLFNSISGRYSYVDGALALNNFLVEAFAAEVELNGIMTGDRNLNFDVKAQNVNLANIPLTYDNIVLEGFVNARGKLRGTASAPVFAGGVTGDHIGINGETITEIDGQVDFDGKEKNLINISFKQPRKANPVDYGLYSADLNVNIPQHFVSGEILTMWGDIGSILRMCRIDHKIEGLMNGRITMNRGGKGSGVDIDVTANDVMFRQLQYHQMSFRGHLKDKKLYFDDVRLQEQQGVEDKGIVVVKGDIDLGQREYNVRLEAQKANPGIVAAVMKNPRDIKGEVDLRADLGGSFDDPVGSAAMEIYGGSIDGVGLDMTTALLTLQDDNIKLHQLLLTKGGYNIRASGDIPMDLFRLKRERRKADAHMKIQVDLNEARLGLLPALTDFVEWGIGDIQGKVTIDGTLEEPLLYGSLQIREGSLKFKNMATVLENISLVSDFGGNKITLTELSAKLGKGSLRAAGTYALNTSADTAYSLQVKADRAEVNTSIFKGTVTGEMDIIPQRYYDYRNHKGGGSPPSGFRPMLKGRLGFDDVLVNMPTVPEFGDGASNYGMDLQIELGPKIHFYNSYLYDVWIDGGLHLKGSTVFPIIEGSLRAKKGTITYLRTNFKIDEARLVWVDIGSFMPNINLESHARFNGYNIVMRLAGPVENMDLQLTSDPPLDKNTIVRMLTLQRDMTGNNDITSEDMANLLTAGLQMTILGEVEDFVEKWLGLDQFRIYNGRVRSRIGYSGSSNRVRDLTREERRQYNVLVSKYLTDHFMVGYTTSFDGIDRSIFGQYDISNNFNITYSRNSGFQKKAEHWFGLEYKVSF